jgi:hypothetical protein
MKKQILLILNVFILCLPSFTQTIDNNASALPNAASNSDYTKPFSEMVKEREAYFKVQVEKYGTRILEGEGSPYNEYQKWLQFWRPRIGPEGTYAGYNKNLKDYWDIEHQPNGHHNEIVTKSFGNTDNWRELGPIDKPASGKATIGGGERGIGPIKSIDVNRVNSNKILVNSTQGGVFYSSDKGVSWINAGSDKWYRSGCNTVAFAPNNETTWYAGSSSGNSSVAFSSIGSVGGVYRTTNSGSTWEIIADRMTFNSVDPIDGESFIIHKIIIDPKNPSIGYIATSRGLFKSTNIDNINPALVIWTLVHTGLIEDIEFKTDLSVTTTVIISSWDGTSWLIEKSINQGASWTSIGLPPIDPDPIVKYVLEVSDAATDKLFVLRVKTTFMNDLWIYDFTSTLWNERNHNFPGTSFSQQLGYSQHAFCVSNFNADIIYLLNSNSQAMEV